VTEKHRPSYETVSRAIDYLLSLPLPANGYSEEETEAAYAQAVASQQKPGKK